jgi:hypothetical protein
MIENNRRYFNLFCSDIEMHHDILRHNIISFGRINRYFGFVGVIRYFIVSNMRLGIYLVCNNEAAPDKHEVHNAVYPKELNPTGDFYETYNLLKSANVLVGGLHTKKIVCAQRNIFFDGVSYIDVAKVENFLNNTIIFEL